MAAPASVHEQAMFIGGDPKRANAVIKRECVEAAKNLEVAWGKGGSQGMRGVKQFDKWFRQLTGRILDLHAESKLDKSNEEEALTACAKILALDGVPHWNDGHVEDIISIREALRGNQDWGDYPPEDDEDDEGM